MYPPYFSSLVNAPPRKFPVSTGVKSMASLCNLNPATNSPCVSVPPFAITVCTSPPKTPSSCLAGCSRNLA